MIRKLQKGDILILDNAGFHQDGIIRKLLRKTGFDLRYLSLYSTDLNKIIIRQS